ncbi:MAG: metallophosphoesterase [Clostridia bacterium]|nr:metallophosphoesterase [Clostridia bacterium]
MKKIISVLFSVSLLVSCFVFGASAEDDALRFGADGKFTVLQITDTQDDAYIAHGLKEFIEKAIEETNPDFIVITGDIVEDSRAGDISDDKIFQEGVSVDGDYAATLTNTKKACEDIFAPVEASGIPYAVSQGNNDYKSGVTNEDWLRIYSSYSNNMTVDMSDDAEGKIDCYIPVLSSDSDEPAFGLWILDNGRGFSDGQLEWFKGYETQSVPSVVFEHIPVDDMGNLYEECSIFDEGALIDGTETYRLKGDIAGGHAEGVIRPGTSTAEFAAWKQQNVVGAFFGHWHTSGFTGVWDGITLGLTYGCQFSKAGPYGVRTVILDEASGTIETEQYEYIDGEFVLQIDEPYAQYDNAFEETVAKAINFFKNLFNALTYLLKF